MAKQPFDHIEDRFREAAENISFPPNEQAWKKMEQLLDKPKHRRGIFFWWFTVLFGILGGIGLTNLLFDKNPESTTAPTVISTRMSKESPASGMLRETHKGEHSKQVDKEQTPVDRNSDEHVDTVTNTTKDDPAANIAVPEGVLLAAPIKNQRQTNINRAASRDLIAKRSNRGTGNKARVTKFSSYDSPQKSNRRSENTVNEETVGVTDEEAKKQTETSDNADRVVVTAQKDTAASTAMTNDATDTVSTVKVKVSKPSGKWVLDKGFNISFATRLDATTLHHIDLTKFDQLFGGTIGYRFSNHVSVQTGLFFQKSVYYAGPDDYYVKPGSYLSYYRISKIDAVCSIYDIPLSVRYDVITGKNTRFFANAGMSSFFLKSENYRYHATGSSGYRMFDSTYKSNKNFFASAYFSVGMERKIAKSFSIQAEPYVRVPVSGIGAGRVKLFSAGMQVSVRFQPQKKELSLRK